MNNSTKKTLKIGLPLLLAICFGWYTFTQLPIKAILPYFKSANYWWILLGVFFGFLSHLSRAYRWKYLLEPMGYTLRFPNSVMAVFITYLANYGIPRSGEVLRAAVLTNYEAVPFQKSFGTIVAERMADLVVMLGIIGFTLLIQFDYIYELLSKSIDPQRLVQFAVAGLISFGLIFIILKKSQYKIALKIKSFLSGLIEGVLSIFKMKHKWAFICHTLFIWFMYLLMFYVTTLALPDLDTITVGAILVAFIAASFTIAATNGGIFVYPVAVMKAFGVFGIAAVPSLAFGWIMWTSQTIMIIIFGTLSFILIPVYNRKK